MGKRHLRRDSKRLKEAEKPMSLLSAETKGFTVELNNKRNENKITTAT
jgi:hypothetical protein